MFFLDGCLYTMYMPGAHRGQNSVSDPLELLGLQTIVSHHAGVKLRSPDRATTEPSRPPSFRVSFLMQYSVLVSG